MYTYIWRPPSGNTLLLYHGGYVLCQLIRTNVGIIVIIIIIIILLLIIKIMIMIMISKRILTRCDGPRSKLIGRSPTLTTAI